MDEAVIDFKLEAQQVLKEISYAILEGALSETLASDANCAYFNLTTKEKAEMTIRLCSRGFEVFTKSRLVVLEISLVSFHFKVVGHSHDNCVLEKDSSEAAESTLKAFETIYALLQEVSPSYQQSFQDAVTSKLQQAITKTD